MLHDSEPKPVEDGFPFVLEQDSLADSMGAKLPNRSIGIIQERLEVVNLSSLNV